MATLRLRTARPRGALARLSALTMIAALTLAGCTSGSDDAQDDEGKDDPKPSAGSPVTKQPEGRNYWCLVGDPPRIKKMAGGKVDDVNEVTYADDDVDYHCEIVKGDKKLATIQVNIGDELFNEKRTEFESSPGKPKKGVEEVEAKYGAGYRTENTILAVAPCGGKIKKDQQKVPFAMYFKVDESVKTAKQDVNDFIARMAIRIDQQQGCSPDDATMPPAG